MANSEHLKILGKGVEAWNAWRKANPQIEPDLSQAELIGQELAGIDFKNTNLSFTRLCPRTVKNANFRGANLTSANLEHANDFSEVDLTDANLANAYLPYVNLSKSILTKANLTNANLSNARLQGASLEEARLYHAQLNEVDFSGVNLKGARLEHGSFRHAWFTQARDLTETHFGGADLFDANLEGCTLENINFGGANLEHANLIHTNLTKASFQNANLNNAKLTDANLTEAHLDGATFRRATLDRAKLIGATLWHANLSGASLDDADFTCTVLQETIFSNINLSRANGLGTCRHNGPSVIDHQTLIHSNPLPLPFLRGCGLPESFITHINSLFQGRSIQFYNCFISHSTIDITFCERLYTDLQNNEVRCYYSNKNMKGGQYIFDQVESAIRVYDKMLLVLSEHSLKSEWVITEIRRCLKEEKKEGKRKLFPIRLVDMQIIKDWECIDHDTGKDLAVEVRKYFIPDFSNWKDFDSYKEAFDKLLRDLQKSAEEIPQQ